MYLFKQHKSQEAAYSMHTYK